MATGADFPEAVHLPPVRVVLVPFDFGYLLFREEIRVVLVGRDDEGAVVPRFDFFNGPKDGGGVVVYEYNPAGTDGELPECFVWYVVGLVHE